MVEHDEYSRDTYGKDESARKGLVRGGVTQTKGVQWRPVCICPACWSACVWPSTFCSLCSRSHLHADDAPTLRPALSPPQGQHHSPVCVAFALRWYSARSVLNGAFAGPLCFRRKGSRPLDPDGLPSRSSHSLRASNQDTMTWQCCALLRGAHQIPPLTTWRPLQPRGGTSCPA